MNLNEDARIECHRVVGAMCLSAAMLRVDVRHDGLVVVSTVLHTSQIGCAAGEALNDHWQRYQIDEFFLLDDTATGIDFG
ncbi:MAG: hypothetical protein PGN34_15090 [Methylobacterium frigidaeris]